MCQFERSQVNELSDTAKPLDFLDLIDLGRKRCDVIGSIILTGPALALLTSGVAIPRALSALAVAR
jgi:hypothetical protein